jgi:serine/threonine protein kinase
MYSRHQFLSPDLKPVYPVSRPDRLLPSPVSHTLARYSSARMFERMTLPAPESEASLKKRIENYTYRTSNCIGEGYTSKVYKCSKDGSNETFAIKVVDLKKYSASNREMLESEVSIVRQLDHPNIIKCYDVMLTSNHCYIVTEFCEGGDLLALMKKVGKGRPLD